MKRLAALLATLVVSSGCGGENARDALAETAERMGEIRSGTLLLRVEVTSAGERAGFAIDGPFALADDAESLPVADVTVTRFAGEDEASTRIISTGEEAFVQIGEATYELPPEQAEELGGAGAPLAADTGLGVLEIGDWFRDPELHEDDVKIGGDATDRIASSLDVVAALNDLLAVSAGTAGGRAPTLAGKSADQVRNAVERATVEVFTGSDDRLLRRLLIDARFDAALPPKLRGALGDVPAARFRLALTIVDPNEEIRAKAPANAQPFPG